MPAFTSEKDLENWLSSSGMDTSQWGIGGAKTMANLWQEYVQGEVTFVDDPPTRLVRVVEIFLRRDEMILLEIAQEFEDGQLRQRRLPPSEKIIGDESVIAAAERCLREELGVDAPVLQMNRRPIKRITSSPSYPGLRTHYTIYMVKAPAVGLPGDDFWRENEAFGMGDPVRRHLWGWRRSAGLLFGAE